MKVYFTAFTPTDGIRSGYERRYKKIIHSIKRMRQILVSGEQSINRELLLKDQKLTPKQIFAREKKRLRKSDCVVAEVSFPSLGVGEEISYALSIGKPVLALFYKEATDKLSPMIAGNPSQNLYLEHYNDDLLKIILKNFFHHLQNNNLRKGKLIVIEGGDGSGKTVQAKMLVEFLRKKKKKVRYIDFPQYYTSFHGAIIGDYLAGKYGKFNEISPYLISLAYALDRASVKEEMEGWLREGAIIIANRYTTSNMAFQTARISPRKRREFLEWLDRLEYRVNKIPREDLVIFLYVPWQIAIQLTKKKAKKRRYLHKPDLHESDIDYRQKVERMYLWLSRNKKEWVKINCFMKKKLESPQVIHQKIIKILEEKKII